MTVDGAEKPRRQLRCAAANPKGWLLLAFWVIVLVTNSGFSQEPVNDALSYREIAAAAPGFPTDRLGSAYTGRFVIHYLVGLLSSFTGISIDAAYNFAWATLMVAILVVVFILFRRSSVIDFALCSALFVFNPYALRPYILQTNLLQDLVFVAALGVCMFGLRRRSTMAVLLGLAVAVVGRQTAIVVAPVAAAWVLLDPAWQTGRAGRRPWPTALFALVTTLAIFAGIKVGTGFFSLNYEPSLIRDTILKRIFEGSISAPEMAAHLARTAVPLVLPITIFVALLIMVGWRSLTFMTWGSLLIAAAIVAQPLMIDPAWPGFQYNEQRLAALGLLPLICAVADLLNQTCRRSKSQSRLVLIFALLAVASLHHEFSSFGPQSLVQFLGLELVVAATVAILIVFDRRSVPSTGRKRHAAANAGS